MKILAATACVAMLAVLTLVAQAPRRNAPVVHPVRDRDVDNELLGLLKERSQVFFTLTLFAARLNVYILPSLRGSASRPFATLPRPL